MRDYAKEHDIQLLTHNDPHLEMLSEQVGKLVEPLFGEKSVLDLKWLARSGYFLACTIFPNFLFFFVVAMKEKNEVKGKNFL